MLVKTTVNNKLFERYYRLNREATALKQEGKINEAIEKLMEAYREAQERKLSLTVKDYLRLPAYLQEAKRNDEAWSWFNRLIQECASDFMSLSDIYDKMRLFRQREKAHKDAVKYGVLAELYWCLGLHEQVHEMGWTDRRRELTDCKKYISDGYEKLLKRAKCEHLEKRLKKLIKVHMKEFPNISTSQLIKDIEALLA
ncbi:MAG: hypothetical protein KKD50_08635 [Proteobacteria bacterium]|nr:hypothetical protein [Pseudomonadota bacterium]